MNRKTAAVLLILAVLLIAVAAQGKPDATAKIDAPAVADVSSPLSIDHMIGVYTFAQPRSDAFVNGYIEFFPDHRWTLVAHFDNNRDRITDHHEVIHGSYYVTIVGNEPTVILKDENGQTQQVRDVVFRGGHADSFLAHGFSFVRKAQNAPYFDQRLNVPDTAKELKVTSNPPGAAVYLDSVRVDGNTPLTIPNPPANRPLVVRVEMLGYSPYKEQVTLMPGQSKDLHFNLAFGESELWIATEPWTRVIVDDKYRGNAPLKIKELPAGQHTVRLENSGSGIKHVFEVELEQGQILKKKFNFTGKLDIFVDKPCQIVDKEGKVIGNAPMQGLELSVGNHVLRLVDENKKMKVINVKIKLDETTVFNKSWKELADI